MFIFAIFIGVYSFAIFILGILRELYPNIIVLLTLLFVAVIVFWKKTGIISLVRFFIKQIKKQKISNDFRMLLLLLLIFQLVVNFIGALSPELSFDALWYHLTLPKFYLENHAIIFVPGGLLYYSAMPKLGELLYLGALSFGNETTVKLLHMLFGVLTTVALYKLARMFFSQTIALLALVIFFSNLVMAWESTVAYIDLIRAFYEVLALWAFMEWYRLRTHKWIILSAIMVGFAITTKLLAIGSLCIFVILITYAHYTQKSSRIITTGINVFLYIIIALLIPMPWFIFAFIHTGNPVYPFFSEFYRVNPEPLSLFSFFQSLWIVFTKSSDPVSPMYIIMLPLILIFFSKFSKELKIISLYSLLTLIIWYFTPRTGGGRFILPYLPAFSLMCAAVVALIKKSSDRFSHRLYTILVSIIFLLAIISISYRFAATLKYLPVVFGKESKSKFLTGHLNFTYGDFYDVDNYFATHIGLTDRVLLYGFHNLYYVNFPYIHSSWVKKGDEFTYVAVQGESLPLKYANWHLVYENAKTTVKLYAPPVGKCDIICVY